MIACVVVSYFAAILESYVRTAPDVPCILVAYRGQRGKVVAYSEDAHKLGVERGQSVSRARSLCPQADILPINPERYAQARNALLNIPWEFTNRVEIDETVYPHTAICYLDLGNLNVDALALLGSLMLSALREHIGVSASVWYRACQVCRLHRRTERNGDLGFEG